MEFLKGSWSDDDTHFEINKSYASKYNNWRKGEELCKLKNRYGSDALEKLTDTSSSEDDDDAVELTDQVEKDFFKTLSCLKQKDPSIYDQNVNFFSNEFVEENPDPAKTKRKKTHNKPLFLRDYERKLILEREGILSDDEESDAVNAAKNRPLSIVEEEKVIKASFKGALNDSDEDDNDLGGLFQQSEKTEVELEKENEGYVEWLKGQKDDIQDKDVKSNLKYLHDYWNNPKLDKDEQFLKDYLLNRKFLEKDDDDCDGEDSVRNYDEVIHDSDQDLSEDERTIEKQTEFEHKYNFRYEEPDQDFIKRFPRTMESSLRKKDDRRKQKREEQKERKIAEKTRMRDEVKQMKALKRKEILERIEKLKAITGNNEVGFNDKDLEGDFDPTEHDKRMGQLFNEEFYGGDDAEKPEFPEMDKELELEKWDDWNGESSRHAEQDDGYEPHCEDPDFNMDCEYNPMAEHQAEVLNSTRRKKRNRRSKFEEVLTREKPIFDPNDHTFDEYVNEYYNLDFEDVIGDLPCRFKYRKVVANSFGLTIDEILKADDKELNRWCSLKKAVQHRPEHVEAYDIKAYQRKSRNDKLKRKILPSLFKVTEDSRIQEGQQPEETKKKSMKRKNHEMNEDKHESALKLEKGLRDNSLSNVFYETPTKIHKSVKENLKKLNPMSKSNVMSQDVNKVISLKKSKKKEKGRKLEPSTSSTTTSDDQQNHSNRIDKKYLRNKWNQMHSNTSCEDKNEGPDISDTRLRAYGIKPKKYKNKLKYNHDKKPAYLKYHTVRKSNSNVFCK